MSGISTYILRQQVRHVLDEEDAAMAAANNIEDTGEYLRVIAMRRATLHIALRNIANLLDGVDREVQE